VIARQHIDDIGPDHRVARGFVVDTEESPARSRRAVSGVGGELRMEHGEVHADGKCEEAPDSNRSQYISWRFPTCAPTGSPRSYAAGPSIASADHPAKFIAMSRRS
jgi:hypothetical protein